MRILITFIMVLLFANPVMAAETRGLRVVAKDAVTNQSGEVKLYNKSYAVIIGIDQYQNLPPSRQLSYAVKDAEGVAATLKKHFRFDHITTLYNQEATKERIMKLLTSELPRDMGSEDAVFLFWAGHGNQDSSEDGEIGYLIPFDGSADEIYKNITMTEIRDTVSKKLPAKHVFYTFDACYSGLLTTRAVDTRSRRDLAYMKEITKERVRQVLTAGSKGQEVLDGGRNGHSVFTGRLIEILEAAGDYITANEIQSIIKEKVYGDAIGRGLNQKPDFGRLSGSGDFVFIPNIEQKVQDNKAELVRMEAELKRYEAQEAEAIKHQSDQKQREAEQKRKAAEARLKAEQLRQQQLAEEEKRQQEMSQERSRFDAEQKLRDQERSDSQKAEEKRLAALKAELARKRQTAPTTSTGSLAAAIAEIKRLNSEIEGIEAAFNRELATGKTRISTRYDKQISAIRLASKQKQTLPVKDEFETEAEYRAKVARQQSSFGERISELERRKQKEINELEQRLAHEQQSQTADLRQSLKQLADKELTVGSDMLALEIGAYNPDKLSFPVSIRNIKQSLKVAMNGTISLPRDAARKFKQEYTSGLVRAEATVKVGSGNLLRVALANDSDSSIYEYFNGEFIPVAERELRQTVGEMVNVSGGCFQMGDNFGDSNSDEKPAHEVCISSFRIGKYEVTQGQWQRIMGSNSSKFSSCGDNCPVEKVSWDDVQDFIRKLNSQSGGNYRLPTEAEWEYACRSGGKNEEYCGSDDVDVVAWYDNNSGSNTHKVGTKHPNGLGVYNMSGNVWEWVSDRYGNYPSARQQDPQGAFSGFDRVGRGGSWGSGAGNVRAAHRSSFSPDIRYDDIGFRLASPVQ